MPATHLRGTVATGVAVNLSTAGISAAQQPTVILSAPPYFSPLKRQDVDLRLARY